MWLITPDLAALKEAVQVSDLRFIEGRAPFHHSQPDRIDGPAGLVVPGQPIPLADHILQLPGRLLRRLRFRAHEVGVMIPKDHPIVCLWDDSSDGYGLVDFVGKRGELLWMNYADAALTGRAGPAALSAEGWDLERGEVSLGGVLTLTFTCRSPGGSWAKVTIGPDQAVCLQILIRDKERLKRTKARIQTGLGKPVIVQEARRGGRRR